MRKNKTSINMDNLKVYSLEQLQDSDMKKGLFSASTRPTRLSDIQNFKILHNPRLYGMTEWLLQYENVCRQQDIYLQQTKELRLHFQKKRKKILIARSDNNVTEISDFFWQSGIPLNNHLHKKFQNKADVHEIKFPKTKRKITTDHRKLLKIGDSLNPEAANLIPQQNVTVTGLSIKCDKQSDMPPTIEEIDRKTDYEPIEIIVKRNQLYLSKYYSVNSENELFSNDGD